MTGDTRTPQEETESTHGSGVARLLAAAIGSFAAIWLAFYLALCATGHESSAPSLLESFFSAVALAGVIVAILLQSEELRLQRRELRLTTGELRKQAESLELHSRLLAEQRFESTFFNMLRFHSEVRDAFGFRGSKGRAALEGAYASFCNNYTTAPGPAAGVPLQAHLEKHWNAFLAEHHGQLGHYFRNLYNLFRLIDETPDIDRARYVRIARAQLSDYELALLLYNCIGHSRGAKMLTLVRGYHLLNNLPPDIVIHPTHAALAGQSAFD